MEQKAVFTVKGMHCASCSAIIEKTLKKIDGVASAEVSYATETARVSFDGMKTDGATLSKAIEHLGYSLTSQQTETAESMGMSVDEHASHTGLGQSKQEKLAELTGMRRMVIASIPLTLFSIFVMGWDALAAFGLVAPPTEITKELFHHLLPLMATYMLFVVGTPYLLGVWRFMRYGAANMDTLIGIGTSVAYFYSFIISAFEEPLKGLIDTDHTYYDVTIVVIAFITLGKYLEARAKLKTGAALEKLLNLQAKTALVIRNGKEMELPVGEVVHGDMIIVKPGARIPVDGTVTEGASFVDESMVTGEPMPVKKKMGNAVVAGTINTTGSFIFTATKVGKETLLARIVQMVQEAQGSRAPIQALADKISSVFVPIVLGISFVSLAAWIIIGTPILGAALALSYGLASFVGVLVIACPCALGLATPTAIIVGVGKGAEEGILIKDAATLEMLHKANTVVMDKTGTITKGKPELTDIRTYGNVEKNELIAILASLEAKSEHPIAHAITEYAKTNGIQLRDVTNFEALKGKGLTGSSNGTRYFAGNTALMNELAISFDVSHIETETQKGSTPLLLANEKEVLAIIMIADSVKAEAVEAVQSLHEMGIKTIMLTGDNKNTAAAIARAVGIDEVIAEVLPDEKLKKIKELQNAGRVVAMVGDGVNDAPALAQANVGIAMGTGTDVAIETAGITLLHGDISKLVKAIRLSRLTMRGIRQNLFWAFAYNVVGIPLAAGALYPAFGLTLSPVFAGAAMALSSVSVVANSLRLKAKKI